MSCDKCDKLMELFKSAEQTNRNYWLMTELFVMLHNGKDVCSGIDREEPCDDTGWVDIYSDLSDDFKWHKGSLKK